MRSEASSGRYTPYELVYGSDGLAEREFPPIREEAESRGIAVSRRDQFAGLDGVGAVLRQVVPAETHPVALDRHLDLLFHCFNFWMADRPLYAFDAPVLRSLIDQPPELGGWHPRAMHTSLYMEFPRNLFWAAVTEDEPPEPLEGLFALWRERRRAALEIELLLVLGMRPDRPGFSVAGVTVGLEQALVRRGANAFRSEIPGADLAGLYSLRQSSEAAVLLVRSLWYIDVYPESTERVSGIASPQRPGWGMPTALDHYRVGLVERSRG